MKASPSCRWRLRASLLVLAGALSIFAAVQDVTAETGLSIDFDEVPTVHFPVRDRVVSAYPAFEDYAFMLFDICDAAGFEAADCQIFPMNADLDGNALATILDGNRVIVYDRQLSSLVGYEGAEMIIAHELGHHHCGHLGTASDPAKELEADAFAGAVARLLRRSLEAALAAVPILSERPSLSHPGRQARIEAITAGWSYPELGRNCEMIAP